ncbi:MAG: ABC transporter permease [Desulfomicrobium sp.]|nr:ABC transporter permease [Desulfomicrobium sp.]MBV1719927.1 ABC transporter permease [Desulfomicrobium sp.]MBV1748772.1 ABC transporter permease [Desulfomicrobium sp.]
MLTNRKQALIMGLPLGAVLVAFFLLPMARLILETGTQGGVQLYLDALTKPRYLASLFSTITLSAVVTFCSLALSGVVGVFLARNSFPTKRLLVSMLTFPLAFPGVVVGFMVILWAGRQGLLGQLTKALTGDKIVLAYSMSGLFLGYLYFSIPRVVTAVMAAAEKINPELEEAARSLGASPWRVIKDVIIPALTPAFISSGAICFATSMGAFGTAFTLATDIDVLPITIYTEFTLSANIGMAACLSIILGTITWAVLFFARIVAREDSIGAAG